MEEFIDDCISSGKVIQNGKYILNDRTTMRIEDILNRHHDSRARTKIRKLLKEVFSEGNKVSVNSAAYHSIPEPIIKDYIIEASNDGNRWSKQASFSNGEANRWRGEFDLESAKKEAVSFKLVRKDFKYVRLIVNI